LEGQFVGINFNFSQYLQDNVEEALSGVKGENSVKLFGSDLEVLEAKATEIKRQLDGVRGVRDLGIFRELGQPNLVIKIDRAAAARYSLSTGDINAVIQAAVGGQQATTVYEGEWQFPLVVRLAPEYRNSIENIRNIPVAVTAAGGGVAYIPLGDLAAIGLDSGASYIYRENNARYIPLKFSVRERDLGGTIAEAQERVESNVTLPERYRTEWSGEFGSLQEAKARLAYIVPLSFLLILMLLYGLFNSLRYSLLALAGIPFALCGGVVALFAARLNFSISAAVGFISLLGVSVMNGILMLTYYQQGRAAGLPPEEAMLRSAHHCMRPVLMTALSACIGLLPAALSTGIGSQVQRPLATVVVGGMLVEPFTNLLFGAVLRMVFVPRASGAEAAPANAEDMS
jgi:cobalt-zinc-cadmium resistance protein CzcA